MGYIANTLELELEILQLFWSFFLKLALALFAIGNWQWRWWWWTVVVEVMEEVVVVVEGRCNVSTTYLKKTHLFNFLLKSRFFIFFFNLFFQSYQVCLTQFYLKVKNKSGQTN